MDKIAFYSRNRPLRYLLNDLSRVFKFCGNYQSKKMASILVETRWSADTSTISEEVPVSESHKPSWTDIAAAKKEEVNARIPLEWVIPEDLLPSPSKTRVDDFVATSGFFTANEIKITGSSATDITANIVGGVWTAEDVTRAFCKAAAVSHQLVCLLSVEFKGCTKLKLSS